MRSTPDVPIGAHIQIKGGLARGGLAYTDAVAARAVQVFVGNPRGWKRTDGDPRQDALFVEGCAERGVPAFIHTPFLVNVGSPSEATVEQSIATIRHNLARGRPAACRGVGVHVRPGAFSLGVGGWSWPPRRRSAPTGTRRRWPSCTTGCCPCSTSCPRAPPGC